MIKMNELKRICQLAGLKESISNDTEVNQRIENVLSTLSSKEQTLALDVLEILKMKGPLTAQQWTEAVRELHPTIRGKSIAEIVKKFPFVVRRTRDGLYRWEDDGLGEVPEEMFQAIGLSTQAINDAEDIIRNAGEIALDDWADQLSNRIPELPPTGPFSARAFLERIIQNLPMNIKDLGNGWYAYEEVKEEPLAFIRQLGKKKK